MKICLLKFYGWPESFNERVNQLADRVDEIVVIKPKNVDLRREPTGIADNVSVISLYPSRRPVMKPRFKTIVLPFYTIQAVIFYFWFAAKRGHCDVFHSFDRPFASMAAAILGTITGRPHVASVRGLILPRYGPRGSFLRQIQNRLLQFFLRPLIVLSLRGCDHVITKAEFQRSVVADIASVNPKQISTIPTGVDYDLFSPTVGNPDRSVLRELLNNSSRADHVVLFLGKLVSGKGADTFVEYALTEEYPDDVEFLMVGECLNREFESELRKAIAASESGSRITLHADRIPFEDVPALMAEVDAVTLLSRSGVEGVPRVLQEACVSETPIIAADVDGISGAFKGFEGCHLIRRESATEFREAVLASRESKPDREKFRSSFDINRNYTKYVDIYRSVSNRNEKSMCIRQF